jgi:hypothetical protein
MSDLAKRAVIAPSDAVGRDLWIACAAVMVVAIVISGGLIRLTAQYRGGSVVEQQVSMDKATAIHHLLFRE